MNKTAYHSSSKASNEASNESSKSTVDPTSLENHDQRGSYVLLLEGAFRGSGVRLLWLTHQTPQITPHLAHHANSPSALVKTPKVLADYQSTSGPSERLAVDVSRALDHSGLRPRDIDRVMISSGPGSFTGIKIIGAFARGWHSITQHQRPPAGRRR